MQADDRFTFAGRSVERLRFVTFCDVETGEEPRPESTGELEAKLQTPSKSSRVILFSNTPALLLTEDVRDKSKQMSPGGAFAVEMRMLPAVELYFESLTERFDFAPTVADDVIDNCLVADVVIDIRLSDSLWLPTRGIVAKFCGALNNFPSDFMSDEHGLFLPSARYNSFAATSLLLSMPSVSLPSSTLPRNDPVPAPTIDDDVIADMTSSSASSDNVADLFAAAFRIRGAV
jgi:hypothetical protein